MRYTWLFIVILLLVSRLAMLTFANSGIIQADVNVAYYPANVVITQFSAPSSVSKGAPITFVAVLDNIGQMASGNVVATVSVSGPSPSSLTEDIGPFYASQNKTLIISMGNATASPGIYTANLIAEYFSGNTAEVSSNTLQYLVTGGSQTGPGPGGGASGGIGVGGGTFKPTVSILNNTCYAISNLTTPDFATVTFTTGSFNIRANFISPTSAGVTINNGSSYDLFVNTPVSISKTSSYNYSLLLENISYIPAVHTLVLHLCSNPTNPALENVTTTFQQGSQQAQQSNLVTPMPQLYLTFMPVISDLIQGFQSISNIGVQNLENFAETVTVSVPSTFSNLVSVSYKNVVLSPKQSLAISILFNATGGVSPGTYLIPINITTNSSGRSTTQTEYISQTVFPNTADQPIVLNQINLINNTQAMSGIIEVKSPQSKNFSGLVLTTVIPPGIAKNISDISTFGINATVEESRGSFDILWHLDSLPANSTVYGYYSIKHLMSQSQVQLRYAQNILVQPSQVTPNQVLKALNVEVPTMYVNSTSTIHAKVFYTGVKRGEVTFTLSGPTSQSIFNSTQTFNVTPNSYVYANFGVRPNSTGTLSMNLNVSTQGLSVNYPVVALVLYNGQQAQGNTIAELLLQDILNSNLIVYLLAILILVLIAGASYMLLMKFLENRKMFKDTGAFGKEQSAARPGLGKRVRVGRTERKENLGARHHKNRTREKKRRAGKKVRSKG